MHPLLRDVNDMGELQSEHPENFSGRLMMFGPQCLMICICVIIAITICSFMNMAEQAKAKPNEVPPHFFLVAYRKFIFNTSIFLKMYPYTSTSPSLLDATLPEMFPPVKVSISVNYSSSKNNANFVASVISVF